MNTCVCLRLREQCLSSQITSVARVANVLLLRFVAGNMDVNTLAFKRSQLIGNTAIVRKRRVSTQIRHVCACVFQLPRLHGNARTQGSTCGRHNNMPCKISHRHIDLCSDLPTRLKPKLFRHPSVVAYSCRCYDASKIVAYSCK